MCLAAACRYVAPSKRVGAAWWLACQGGACRLDPTLQGSLTRFRFVADSSVYAFSALYTNLTRVAALSNLVKGAVPLSLNCTNASFSFVNKDASVLGMGLVARSGSNLTVCFNYSQFGALGMKVFGANSLLHFTAGSSRFLAVANFWDGEFAGARSPVFRFDAANSSATFVLDVPTSGARQWEAVRVGGALFLAVANFLSESPIYFVSGAQPLALNKSATVSKVPGLAAIQYFSADGADFLAVASFTAPSRLYQLGTPLNATHSRFAGSVAAHDPTLLRWEPWVVQNPAAPGALSAVQVQVLDVAAAYDVEYFELDGARYLAVASCSAMAQSALYGWQAGAGLPGFGLVQLLPTANATSVRFWQSAAGAHLVVGQAAGGTLLLRWNGSAFLGLVSVSTPPGSLGGGQLIGSNMALAVLPFAANSTAPAAAANGMAAEYLLVGYFRNGSSGAQRVRPLLFRGRTEHVTGLDGPAAIQVAPADGRTVYVASRFSRCIAALYADPLTGETVFAPGASYFTPWTYAPVTASSPPLTGPQNATGRRLPLTAFGFPVRDVTALALSGDQSSLYAVSPADHAVSVFSVGPAGQLALLQVVQDRFHYVGPAVPGLPVAVEAAPGLGGADGVAVNFTGDSVFVASRGDQAVTAFLRLRNGTLRYTDRLRDGELQFEAFVSSDGYDLGNLSGVAACARGGGAGLPVRLGCEQPWSLTVRDTEHFEMGGQHYLAVAASDPGSAYEAGAAAVFAWNGTSRSFALLQQTDDPSPSSVAFAAVTDRVGAVSHFLAVSNAHGAAGGGSVNVYRWSEGSGRFLWHHQPVSGPWVERVRPFAMDGLDFLAVAVYAGDGLAFNTYSQVLRWNYYGYKLMDDGEQVLGAGYEPFQNFATHGAVDAAFAALDGGATRLLLWANFDNPSNYQSNQGQVDVYVFQPFAYNPVLGTDAGFFALLDSQAAAPLTAAGAHGLEVFAIAGAGDFLAVACRQAMPAAAYSAAGGGQKRVNYTAVDQVPRVCRPPHTHTPDTHTHTPDTHTHA